MKNIVRAALAVSMLCLAPSSAMAAVYAVDTAFLSYAARGTITTNGTVGILGQSDVTGWNLVVSAGDVSRTLTQANSEFNLSGRALEASSSRLTFDFDNPAEAATAISFNDWSTSTFLCLSAPGQFSCGDPEKAIAIGVGDDFWFTEVSGVVTVGTAAVAAVPETSTWGMMLAGFGMLGAGLRGRRRQTAIRFA